MSIDNILMQATSEAVKELYGLDFAAEKVTLQTTKKEFEGNFTVVDVPIWEFVALKVCFVKLREIFCGVHLLLIKLHFYKFEYIY